jgi:hypothetical protein
MVEGSKNTLDSFAIRRKNLRSAAAKSLPPLSAIYEQRQVPFEEKLSLFSHGPFSPMQPYSSDSTQLCVARNFARSKYQRSIPRIARSEFALR